MFVFGYYSFERKLVGTVQGVAGEIVENNLPAPHAGDFPLDGKPVTLVDVDSPQAVLVPSAPSTPFRAIEKSTVLFFCPLEDFNSILFVPIFPHSRLERRGLSATGLMPAPSELRSQPAAYFESRLASRLHESSRRSHVTAHQHPPARV